VDAIEKIENELLKRVFDIYKPESDTLFFDTTNFFTYINTTNTRCSVAQRGKNKQKRYDLRQVGLAMVVTRQDLIPLLHLTYQGNINDTKVFAEIIGKIKIRLISLDLDVEKHTVVFDRGNNSRKNLVAVEELKLHYVGALTPYHHKDLITDAIDKFQDYDLDGTEIQVYRDRRVIWENERTVIVFISEKLKAGQIRGVYQALEKKEKQLRQLQTQLRNPRSKQRDKEQLENKILDILKGQYMNNLINWSLEEKLQGLFDIQFSVDHQKLKEIEDNLGFRIIMTDRHHWNTADIIKAYYGQAKIENAFKDLKNPCHLALKPQFHWTDQKIRVHYFICVMGYLLSAILLRQVREKTKFKGCLDSLLNILCNIRLATLLEESNTRGRVKAVYKLEEMSKEEKSILQALEVEDLHNNRPKLNGVGVYK